MLGVEIMSRVFTGSAVPRHLVFVLEDGAYVVQWDGTRVQELLTGRYREFKPTDFGQPISDYQLTQLKAAGRVEYFTRQYVWLYALPEQQRYDKPLRTQEQASDRVRAYYLNSTLPKSQLQNIRSLLVAIKLEDRFDAANHNEIVAIMGKNGAPFKHLDDAEQAQRLLLEKAPDIFKDAVVAFVDVSARNGIYRNVPLQTSEISDLDTLIKSQTDTTVTAGKRAILVGQRELERKPLLDLLTKMEFDVIVAPNGQEAVQACEEALPDLLMTDLQLTDMHAWEMLMRVREIDRNQHPLTIVIAETGASPDTKAFGRGVAGVDIYLVRPVIIARLRQSIWTLMQQLSAEKKNQPAT